MMDIPRRGAISHCLYELIELTLYCRGLKELQAVLMALYSHLEKLRIEGDATSTEEAAINAKEKESVITKALRSKTSAQLMEDALFGERSSLSSNVGDHDNRPSVRLRTLAKQLRIPLKDAVVSTSILCWELNMKGGHATTLTDWMATPKASHSKRPI
jgi:hypothetical protein